MRITSKGQVTIPLRFREQLGFLPESEVVFRAEGDKLVLEKVASDKGRGKRLVERIRGRATTTMTTDEIMALTRGE